ncbi:MAG: hypothetical protein NZ841_01580 [Dictyoglomus sp.]|nr:hypothetical protein [Dictyoglomus sp.]MDW8187978.1 hypothetical protein [Dictyoglomus sp.]
MKKRILSIVLIIILFLFSIAIADPNEADGNQTTSLLPVVKIEREVSVKD